MDDTRKIYQFVGGSLDGQEIAIAGSPYIGMRWTGRQLPSQKREIYVLHDNDRFCFERYGLDFNPRVDMPDAMTAMQPVMGKLSEDLAELDTILDRFGGPSAGDYEVGNWVIRHRDA